MAAGGFDVMTLSSDEEVAQDPIPPPNLGGGRRKRRKSGRKNNKKGGNSKKKVRKVSHGSGSATTETEEEDVNGNINSNRNNANETSGRSQPQEPEPLEEQEDEVQVVGEGYGLFKQGKGDDDGWDMGTKLLFYCELIHDGSITKYDFCMWQKQTVGELRLAMAEKVSMKPCELKIYGGTFNIDLLHDDQYLGDYTKQLQILDVLVEKMSVEDAFKKGVDTALRLKIQTEDRRGRSDKFVFVWADAPLKDVLTEYAKQIEIDISKSTLAFDGETLDLGKTPDDYELENNYALDLHAVFPNSAPST